jgi:pimeloyl-ACP methyl ester carboxylesterase
MADFRIRLSSGHVLGYAEYGDLHGVPMFYFHGWPSSRFQGELMDEAGKKFGLRIIAPDRPGIATSDFQPGRTLLDWPPLITELADRLGLGKFHVMGVSGGGPYVLVCVHALSDRLLSAGILCGAPPLREVGTEGLLWTYRLGMWAQRRLPFMVGPGLRVVGWIAGRSIHQWPQTWFWKNGATEDLRAMRDPRLHGILMRSTRAAVLSRGYAVRWDGMIYSSDWGFDLAHLDFPSRFWHGALDRNIPLVLAQKAAARVPGATFKIYPQDGHNSLPLLRNEEITAELLSPEKV